MRPLTGDQTTVFRAVEVGGALRDIWALFWLLNWYAALPSSD